METIIINVILIKSKIFYLLVLFGLLSIVACKKEESVGVSQK
jgi:hypothetical protein